MSKAIIRTVLVLDDDPIMLELVQAQLTPATGDTIQYALELATEPQAALDFAARQKVDAVISDFRMPGMSGIEFLKLFSRVQPDAARLILSGLTDTDSVQRMVKEVGIHRFIPKPCSRAELRALLDEAIAIAGQQTASPSASTAALSAQAKSHTLPRPTSTTLRTAPLLAEMPEARLEALAKVAEWLAYAPGENIVEQNEESKSVYFLISGYIKIVRGAIPGQKIDAEMGSDRRVRSRQQVMLALLGPGDMVGEVASLLDTRRSASIVALTPCQLIRISSGDFLDCVTQHPQFAIALARKMAMRLISADRQVELMRGDLEGRIHAILRHCTAIGLDTDRWLSNAEIARMVGATRVAVSQTMSRLKQTAQKTTPSSR